jgi:hypothetical protein
MFEVYYRRPADPTKEAAVTELVCRLGGRLDYREEPEGPDFRTICLTYEFDSLERATAAAAALREQGEHVEGPMDYGTK